MKSRFLLAAVAALLCVSGAEAAPEGPGPTGPGDYSTSARLNGVHGVEILPERGKGYASDGLDRAVVVCDRDTLAERARPFVVNGGASRNVTVIDPATDAIVGAVELGRPCN